MSGPSSHSWELSGLASKRLIVGVRLINTIVHNVVIARHEIQLLECSYDGLIGNASCAPFVPFE